MYLCWYDFDKKTEHVCKGEVVDNTLWADTKYKDQVPVRFKPLGMSQPICHHFPIEKLSEQSVTVPHDDCYLVCGKKRTIAEATLKKETSMCSASKRLIRLKQECWDTEHNHLQTEYLDEFCELWREVVALRMGMKEIKPVASMQVEYPATPQEAITPVVAEAKPKKASKKKRESNTIQLSLF